MRIATKKPRLLFAFAALFLIAFSAVAEAQAPPLSLADLLIGLRSKKVTVEERNSILAAAVTERGVTFVTTPEIEKELSSTGASEVLLSAIREKSPKPVEPPKPIATPIPTPTPPDATFYKQRGEASLAKGELDAALTDFDKALQLKADDPQLWVGRGRTNFGKKSYDLSVKDYDKAIELNPKTAIAFLNRGLSYERLGNVQKALADYRQAVELEPGYAAAKADVKRIEDQLARDAEAARKAKEAEEAVPEYLNLGNLSAADAERMILPNYSSIARQSRVTGKVTVEVELNQNGEVVSAKATSGHAMLRQAAEEAAERSKFKPPTFNGKPTKGRGVIVYSFTL